MSGLAQLGWSGRASVWGGSSSGPSLPGSVRTRSLFLHAPLGPAKSPEAPLLPWVIFSACSSSSPAGAPFLSALFLVLICGGPSPRFCLSPLGGRGKRTGPLPHGCVVCNFCHYRPKLASLSVLRLQPSNARRTHCLALAIADIVWRAGGCERAVVTL